MTTTPDDERLSLFEEWAADYDDDVASTTGFPFAGYGDVLRAAVDAASVSPGMSVLDVGTGTGNLARLFVDQSCVVTGIDFSEKMLSAARERVPDAEFIHIDLLDQCWPIAGHRFDAIASAYVFHEFDDETKVGLIDRFARGHLRPNGRVVIADIGFESVVDREIARRLWNDVWDEDENYWVAEEALSLLEARGLTVSYRQVSSCAGVTVWGRLHQRQSRPGHLRPKTSGYTDEKPREWG